MSVGFSNVGERQRAAAVQDADAFTDGRNPRGASGTAAALCRFENEDGVQTTAKVLF